MEENKNREIIIPMGREFIKMWEESFKEYFETHLKVNLIKNRKDTKRKFKLRTKDNPYL